MIKKVLSVIDRVVGFKRVSAHCDIPCKIYDPMPAQIAVLTMIRLVDLINEIPSDEASSLSNLAKLNRLVGEKEAHGTMVKEEIRVIWGDYFKQPQLDAFPETHRLVHNIMMQASKAKQNVDREETVALLEMVNQFTENFWSTKDIDTYRAVCPYPPNEKIVYPKIV